MLINLYYLNTASFESYMFLEINHDGYQSYKANKMLSETVHLSQWPNDDVFPMKTKHHIT